MEPFVKKRPKPSISRKKVATKSKPSKESKSQVENATIISQPPRRAIIARQSNVTEAELTDGLDRDLRDAWQKLRAFAAGLGTQHIYASPQSIMFAKSVCYFYVRPRKKFLEVWIFLPRKIEGLISTQAPTRKVKYCNLFKVVHIDQIEEPLTEWIREAFNFAP
jgi:hypothetical protein